MRFEAEGEEGSGRLMRSSLELQGLRRRMPGDKFEKVVEKVVANRLRIKKRCGGFTNSRLGRSRYEKHLKIEFKSR